MHTMHVFYTMHIILKIELLTLNFRTYVFYPAFSSAYSILYKE